MTRTVLGHTVRRTEDPALLTGEARFLDDLHIAGALHLVFVRSTMAHAEVGAIDVEDARRADGVRAVFTTSDLGLPPARATGGNEALARPRLATDRVRYVGEPVVAIVAESRAQAVDASEGVVIDYRPLPAVTDPLEAMADDAPLLFPDHGSNIVLDQAPQADDDLFTGAYRVVRARFHNHRIAPVPMETNGCIAVPDGDGLTVWASTQSVFGVRREMAHALGVDEGSIRVQAPVIGGGFGAKGGTYMEQIVTAAIAHKMSTPIRWTETRSENLLAMTHGRGQIQDVEAAVGENGHVLALRVRVVADTGAYATRGAFMPFVTQFMSSGVYRIPKIEFRPVVVVTNTTPTGPYRGAGRPEAAALVERTIDLVADELGIDPVEVRRRNFIPPDDFPYRTAAGAEYDTGDYGKALDLALELVGYDDVRAEQARRRQAADPLLLGVGISCYVEVSGRGSEYGSLAVEDDGSVTVITGTVPHGQGHETVWAQIASDVLGIDMERVRVVHSDTAVVPRGTGTFGSRSLQLGGSAVRRAAETVLDRAKRLAADMLEAAPDDIVVSEGGRLSVAGVPASGVRWAELARAAAEGDGERLWAEVDFEQDGTFPFGAHVAVVEVDSETGAVRLDRLVAVDDCGQVINPLLAEGQVHGGLAQGIAQALFEAVVFDEDGNPITANLADYGMPTAADLPSFVTDHTVTPTPRNPLGAKGIGESGTTGSTPAVWNAVIDALAPYGVRHLDPPFTPEKVWRAMNQGREAR